MATAQSGVLTDYAGGDRGAALSSRRLDRQVEEWLEGLEDVLPGVASSARRVGGQVQAVIKHWPSVPTHQGSYTNNHPGYFTTIAGYEGRAVDNLFFAGEHCDSFYEWQGFMEGAANSGLAAADAITRLARRPRR